MKEELMQMTHEKAVDYMIDREMKFQQKLIDANEGSHQKTQTIRAILNAWGKENKNSHSTMRSFCDFGVML